MLQHARLPVMINIMKGEASSVSMTTTHMYHFHSGYKFMVLLKFKHFSVFTDSKRGKATWIIYEKLNASCDTAAAAVATGYERECHVSVATLSNPTTEHR